MNLFLTLSNHVGIPKPIVWTLGVTASAANSYLMGMPDGSVPQSQLYRSDLIMTGMPLFHAAGIIINLLGPVYCGHRMILSPPGPPLGADAAVEFIKSAGATAAFLPPSTLDEMGKRPELLPIFDRLNFILGAGGIVTPVAGEAIIKRKTTIINILGTTEFASMPGKDIALEDWQYIHFNPRSGVQFRHHSGDEYELHVVRDEKLQPYQPCFELFPDQTDLTSHDLFIKHPTKTDLWQYRGRSDDVIVFLNGEGTNPVSMEQLISSRPEVRSALVFGQGRFEAGLLIEPAQSNQMSIEEKAAFIEVLWPTVEKANQQCPAYAKISKSHIVFADPQKPLPRAGKGTVQRQFAFKEYATEIDAMYRDAENLRDRDVPFEFQSNDYQGSALEAVKVATGIEDLKPDDDFFSRGVDSLQVIQITRILRYGYEHAGFKADAIAPSLIYTNPSAAKLANALLNLKDKSQISEKTIEEQRAIKLNLFLDKYSNTANYNAACNQSSPSMNHVVILTGSTGALGSYLLDALLASKSVSKIYCLNRSADSESRQIRANKARGLTVDWDKRRVAFITAKLGQKDLGLGSDTYTEVLENVDLILHNAWQVDFNLTLESYEQTHIQGVRNLISMSIKSKLRARMFFTSSISSVMSLLAKSAALVPEEIIEDLSAPLAIGYAESKYIAERLLANASKSSGIQHSVCRVGQIAGPIQIAKGMWNPQEWLPSLIISSQYLGVIPDSLGRLNRIDWIPIDILSYILVDLSLKVPSCESTSTATVFHIVNPSTTTWDALLPQFKTRMRPDIQTVPLGVWLKKLRASAHDRGPGSTETLDSNPALKLVEFYEGLLVRGGASGADSKGPGEKNLPTLTTTETQRASPRLGDIGKVKPEWADTWMEQWKHGGLLRE